MRMPTKIELFIQNSVGQNDKDEIYNNFINNFNDFDFQLVSVMVLELIITFVIT